MTEHEGRLRPQGWGRPFRRGGHGSELAHFPAASVPSLPPVPPNPGPESAPGPYSRWVAGQESDCDQSREDTYREEGERKSGGMGEGSRQVTKAVLD